MNIKITCESYEIVGMFEDFAKTYAKLERGDERLRIQMLKENTQLSNQVEQLTVQLAEVKKNVNP